MKDVNDPQSVKREFNFRKTYEEKIVTSYLNFKTHMLQIHNTDVRTEPMSAYAAFLHEEKKEHLKKDTGDGKLDMEHTRDV